MVAFHDKPNWIPLGEDKDDNPRIAMVANRTLELVGTWKDLDE
jgi:hypothetical protein